jgi:uncharacterized protein YjbJ (UPF0337 family)
MSSNPLNASPAWNRIQGSWRQLSGSVKQRWGRLTDDDITEANGNRELLAGKIQSRYGVAQAEANKQIDEWAQNLKF